MCGDDDTYGWKCEGPCPGLQTCEGGPDWHCQDHGDVPDCKDKMCGDDNTLGGKCIGPCPNPGDVCDLLYYACYPPDECDGKNCGESVNGGSCMGPCAEPSTICRLDPVDASQVVCASCSGSGANENCLVTSDCVCGYECLGPVPEIFSCRVEPESCAMGGQCTTECMATRGRCWGGSDQCTCAKQDPGGDCIQRVCLDERQVTGTFETSVVPDCAAAGLTSALSGSVDKWNLFNACRFSTGIGNLVLVYGFYTYQGAPSPYILTIVFDAAALQSGTANVDDGTLFIEEDGVVAESGVLSTRFVRAYAAHGTLAVTGSTDAGSRLNGSLSVQMVDYQYSICGMDSGRVCTNAFPFPNGSFGE